MAREFPTPCGACGPAITSAPTDAPTTVPTTTVTAKATTSPTPVATTTTMLQTTTTAATPAAACASVYNTAAGDYTCGQRIDWLVDSQGRARQVAEHHVAREFPTPCGACGPAVTSAPTDAPTTVPTTTVTAKATTSPTPVATTTTMLQTTTPAATPAATCASVYSAAAGDYTCGQRIDWLVDSQGRARQVAEHHVAREFPTPCGACGPAVTSAPTDAPTTVPTTSATAGCSSVNIRGRRILFDRGGGKCECAGARGTAAGSSACDQGGARSITIHGREIRVGGTALSMKGVCWNPVPKGRAHPPTPSHLLDYARTDAPMMRAAGINVVRPYVEIRDTQVLDVFHQHGIMVIAAVDPLAPAAAQRAAVDAIKGHAAVLMWSLGNEWNYNGLYQGRTLAGSVAAIDAASSVIRSADASRPIVTVYGEVPSRATVASLPNVDVWAINSYRFDDFGDLFSQWAAVSGKPMFLGEFGADAFNSNTGVNAYDPQAQAQATAKLAGQIAANLTPGGGVCSGGMIFEFADEWWKDGGGSNSVHDVGGAAPGGGPFPDHVFNEEWWGLVDIDRNPRPAYVAYQNVAF